MTCRELILEAIKEYESCTYDTLERLCSMEGAADYTWQQLDRALESLESDELVKYNSNGGWFELDSTYKGVLV